MTDQQTDKKTLGNPQVEEVTQVMDSEAIRKALRRIAHEIIEQNHDLRRLVIAGIPTRGKIVASRIASYIAEIEGIIPTLGTVDVSMHRDDLATRMRISVVETTRLFPSTSMIVRSCSLMMCSTREEVAGPPWMPLPPLAVLHASSLPLWWIADTVNCRSGPILSEKMFPRQPMTASAFALKRWTALPIL